MKKEYWVAIILLLTIIVNLALSLCFNFNYAINLESYTDMNSKYSSTSKSSMDASGTSINNPKTDIKYNSNNYNIQYHETPDQLAISDPNITIDASGKLSKQSATNPQVSITYYQPGSYLFGATTYVPNYEDSVYLSKLTGESSVKPIASPAAIAAGFCSQYKDSPDKLEQSCLTTNNNSCSSTSCCVLLGGSKCVSGNVTGPYRKQNYGDVTIRNPDFYYFQGTCYGNCSENKLNYMPLGTSITNSVNNVASGKY